MEPGEPQKAGIEVNAVIQGCGPSRLGLAYTSRAMTATERSRGLFRFHEASMKTMRVLIVDGHRETADKPAHWVASAGHDAKVCEFEVEETARTYRPNIAMLDLELPGADGWGLALSLLSDDHALFIAASTCSYSLSCKLRSDQAGICLFMRNPCADERCCGCLRV